ncbi:hypothetical protein BS50DRAFT_194944 [Corynespora cassiicola Philippines]|uniref:Uncharacterized protein n=1 Tax=Corynespora cassiicola Philippines TaxID=1448308 RepID=A0A2T2P8Q3_CORCC|nr:hypothetical protein BS50DRAFT_194944 [Corynespora cassiicola Philippines]
MTLWGTNIVCVAWRSGWTEAGLAGPHRRCEERAVGRPWAGRTASGQSFSDAFLKGNGEPTSTFCQHSTVERRRAETGGVGAARRRHMRHAIAAPLPHGSRGASVGAAPGRGGGRETRGRGEKKGAGRAAGTSVVVVVVVVVVRSGGRRASPQRRKKKDSCWVCRWVGR